jgi:hypothetical protein
LCGVQYLHGSSHRPKLKRPTETIGSFVTEKATQRRPGSRASDDAALHRRMRQQSLKTSWRNLADACEQLIEWRSFALWVRAIVGAERSLPQWLREAIDQRCPGFLESRSEAADLDSLWLDLSAWIDEHVFTTARTGGWIEALHYYSGRDPRSEQIWRHWERTKAAWREQKPLRYPTADEWHQDALKHDSPRSESAELVTQYIEWEAFALWARLIAERESEVPSDVAAAIEQRCPGFLAAIRSEKAGAIAYSTWFWRSLLAWIETHIVADAIRGPSPDAIRDSARTHLRGERIAEYWADCSSRWQKSPPTVYPSFEQWLQDADAFVAR